MSKDFMRNHLITKFVCSSCGSALLLSYDIPKGANNRYSEDEPTGAAMVEKTVAIQPCKKCLEPANKIKDAVKVLLAI